MKLSIVLECTEHGIFYSEYLGLKRTSVMNPWFPADILDSCTLNISFLKIKC